MGFKMKIEGMCTFMQTQSCVLNLRFLSVIGMQKSCWLILVVGPWNSALEWQLRTAFLLGLH